METFLCAFSLAALLFACVAWFKVERAIWLGKRDTRDLERRLRER